MLRSGELPPDYESAAPPPAPTVPPTLPVEARVALPPPPSVDSDGSGAERKPGRPKKEEAPAPIEMNVDPAAVDVDEAQRTAVVAAWQTTNHSRAPVVPPEFKPHWANVEGGSDGVMVFPPMPLRIVAVFNHWSGKLVKPNFCKGPPRSAVPPWVQHGTQVDPEEEERRMQRRLSMVRRSAGRTKAKREARERARVAKAAAAVAAAVERGGGLPPEVAGGPPVPSSVGDPAGDEDDVFDEEEDGEGGVADYGALSLEAEEGGEGAVF